MIVAKRVICPYCHEDVLVRRSVRFWGGVLVGALAGMLVALVYCIVMRAKL